jgi:hypothetical protein
MNREELCRQQTMARWRQCQEARAAAGADRDTGQLAAAKVWNAWAEPLRIRRGDLERAREWKLNVLNTGDRDRVAWIGSHTPVMQEWLWEARADFSGQTLESTGVTDRLDFSGFSFPGEALFVGTTFAAEAWFEGAKFHGDGWFGESTFVAGCSFAKHKQFGATEFFRDAWFGGARFASDGFKVEYTKFDGVCFHGPARFRPTMFNKVVWFEDATFRDLAWFPQSNFRDYVSFAGTRFLGDAIFGAMHSERSFDMAGTTFRHLPDFVEANFTEPPRLDNVTSQRLASWGAPSVSVGPSAGPGSRPAIVTTRIEAGLRIRACLPGTGTSGSTPRRGRTTSMKCASSLTRSGRGDGVKTSHGGRISGSGCYMTSSRTSADQH